MQFYLSGLNPLFWRSITDLPTSIYNKSNYQGSPANVEQTLVSFVDKPIGTPVKIIVTSTQEGTHTWDAKVVDDSGLVYVRIKLPYTRNEDSISIKIIESSGFVLDSGIFSTSWIVFLFEIQAIATQNLLIDTEQLHQNISIQGVEDNLLEAKFGEFTGLTRRNEQTVVVYRAQTACLWQAYQYASMEQGLLNALHCIIGSSVPISLKLTGDDYIGLIFNRAQFIDPTDVFGNPIDDDYVNSSVPWPDPPTTPMIRDDTDEPHFFVADIDDDYLSATDPQQQILIPGTDNTPGAIWSEDVAQSFVILTDRAISNEVQVYLGSAEADAASLVTDSPIQRRPADVLTGAQKDVIGNINILPLVVVTEMTQNHLLVTDAAFLPVENTDFTINRLSGEITWDPFSTKVPDDSSYFKITYQYRLDEALKIVAKKVKPVFRDVVIFFANVISGLPVSVRA